MWVKQIGSGALYYFTRRVWAIRDRSEDQGRWVDYIVLGCQIDTPGGRGVHVRLYFRGEVQKGHVYCFDDAN